MRITISNGFLCGLLLFSAALSAESLTVNEAMDRFSGILNEPRKAELRAYLMSRVNKDNRMVCLDQASKKIAEIVGKQLQDELSQLEYDRAQLAYKWEDNPSCIQPHWTRRLEPKYKRHFDKELGNIADLLSIYDAIKNDFQKNIDAGRFSLNLEKVKSLSVRDALIEWCSVLLPYDARSDFAKRVKSINFKRKDRWREVLQAYGDATWQDRYSSTDLASDVEFDEVGIDEYQVDYADMEIADEKSFITNLYDHKNFYEDNGKEVFEWIFSDPYVDNLLLDTSLAQEESDIESELDRDRTDRPVALRGRSLRDELKEACPTDWESDTESDAWHKRTIS